jgi:hypothetical protein
MEIQGAKRSPEATVLLPEPVPVSADAARRAATNTSQVCLTDAHTAISFVCNDVQDLIISFTRFDDMPEQTVSLDTE